MIKYLIPLCLLTACLPSSDTQQCKTPEITRKKDLQYDNFDVCVIGLNSHKYWQLDVKEHNMQCIRGRGVNDISCVEYGSYPLCPSKKSEKEQIKELKKQVQKLQKETSSSGAASATSNVNVTIDMDPDNG